MELRAGAPNIAELVRADNAATISLLLSEEAAEQSSWRIRLSVELADGSRGEVGQLVTRTAANAVGRPSRVIGVASCPGAVAWFAEVTLVASTALWAAAVLTASPAPSGGSRAEVVPNRPNADSAVYSVEAGVAVGAVVENVVAGARVKAVSAQVLSTALAPGTVAIAGSDPITVLPGSSVTIEPLGGLMGPLAITFTDVAYLWEQEI